jgi:NDP-sugar pyrophosphorylase family protein
MLMPHRTRFPALIMAGGRSERMRRTAGMHKALIPVLGRSLIQRNLEALLAHGFRDIVVSVSSQDPEIEAYILGDGYALVRAARGSVSCFRETAPLGTIGAARHTIGEHEALLVVNVDNLTTLPLCALAEHHLETQAGLTIACHREAFRIPYGQVIVEAGEAVDYQEKPSFAVLISSGTYIISSEATKLIEPEQRFDITDLFCALRRHGFRTSVFEHSSKWVDVNDADSLKRAEVMFGDLEVANRL